MKKSNLQSIKREAKILMGTPKAGIPTWTNHTIVDLLQYIQTLEKKIKQSKREA